MNRKTELISSFTFYKINQSVTRIIRLLKKTAIYFKKTFLNVNINIFTERKQKQVCKANELKQPTIQIKNQTILQARNCPCSLTPSFLYKTNYNPDLSTHDFHSFHNFYAHINMKLYLLTFYF